MAQIDSRIALGFQPTAQIESPVNNLARILQVQGAQQANQLNQLRMDEYQSGVQRKNKLAALLGGQYETEEAREDAVLRGGFVDEYQGMRKSRLDALKAGADAGKTKADTEKVRLQTAIDKVGFIGQLLNGVSDPMSYARAREAAAANGLDVSQIPEQYDPAQVEQSKARALSVQQQLEQMWKQKGYDLDVEKFGETKRNNQVQNRIAQQNANTSSGQLSLSRERLAFDQGNAVADAGGPNQIALTKQYGKASPGYRWKADGTQEAIPGGPADIKAGEAGAKAQARADAAALAAGNVLDAVKSAKDLVGYGTSGIGAGFARLPGTPARNLQAKLDTIKANLGFDRLQQMREMSPTGGALGAVAVQELIALQSTVASLDQAQSPSELSKSLEKIEGHYNKWLETVNKGAATPATIPNSGNTVTVGGQQYTRPEGMTDQQWADYKKAVGVAK